MARTLFARPRSCQPIPLWQYTAAGLWLWQGTVDMEADTGGCHPVIGVVREATSGDASALSEAMSIPRQDVDRRLAIGKRCFVAHVDNKVVTYGWVSLGYEHIPELERSLCLGGTEGYVWDCFTDPRFRGYGLLQTVLREMSVQIRFEGIARLWAVILSNNLPSQRAFAKASYVDVARLKYLRIVSVRHLWLSGCKEAAPVTVAKGAIALLRRVRELSWQEYDCLLELSLFSLPRQPSRLCIA